MPPVIIQNKCTKCGTCAKICTMDVFGPFIPGQIPEVLYGEECWHCRACVLDCPAQAIEMRYPLPLMMLYQDARARDER